MAIPKNIPQFQYGYYSDMLKECALVFKKENILEFPLLSRFGEARRLYSAGNILDIGAGKAKPFQKFMRPFMKDGQYYSLDNDPQGLFDYREAAEIPEITKFSLIYANQVFEHLTIDQSIEMMCVAAHHLSPGGSIIVTVPNIAHPNRQISNITHITPWGHNSLYMLFRMAGLEVKKIGRFTKRRLRGPIEWIVARYVSGIYRMDWCDSIIEVGIKPL